MEHDRWHWFAGGVVVGVLIGAGIAGSFCFTKIAEARAETEAAREEADLHRGGANAALVEANGQREFADLGERNAHRQSVRADRAEKSLELAEKALEEIQATRKDC